MVAIGVEAKITECGAPTKYNLHVVAITMTYT